MNDLMANDFQINNKGEHLVLEWSSPWSAF